MKAWSVGEGSVISLRGHLCSRAHAGCAILLFDYGFEPSTAVGGAVAFARRATICRPMLDGSGSGDVAHPLACHAQGLFDLLASRVPWGIDEVIVEGHAPPSFTITTPTRARMLNASARTNDHLV